MRSSWFACWPGRLWGGSSSSISAQLRISATTGCLSLLVTSHRNACASHCYLVVVQDIRGQGSSGGVFSEFTHDSDDGYDSVEWAAALPGSDGKVGMYGSSYVGATQWLAAVTAPPHLVAIVPANTASDGSAAARTSAPRLGRTSVKHHVLQASPARRPDGGLGCVQQSGVRVGP